MSSIGERILVQFQRMFDCDTVRISQPCETMFLILGWNRRSDGEWFKNGVSFDFKYIEEKVVARGDTEAELMASAKEYKRVSAMTMEEPAAVSR